MHQIDGTHAVPGGGTHATTSLRRARWSPWRRTGTLVIGAASVALTLSACGSPASPGVASLGTGHATSTTTTTAPAGGPTQLLISWASCARRHGDPDQLDPSVTTDREIAITLPAGWTQGLGGTPPSCRPYLTAAETALRVGQSNPSVSAVTAEKFAECMRAHGLPGYPNPTDGNSVAHAIPGSDLDPNNPSVQAAASACSRQTGFQDYFGNDTPEPGDIVLTLAGGLGGK